MRRNGILLLCAIALGGVALATAGCGGNDSTTTVTVDSSTVESADATTTEAMETTETDTTETEETDTTATETDGDATAAGFATSENCQEFLTLANSISTAMSGSGDTDLQEAADAMQQFGDEAPDEIKDDFETLADVYSKLADALEGVDMSSSSTPSADAMAKLANLSGAIDQAKLTTASSNISTWVTENCSATGGG